LKDEEEGNSDFENVVKCIVPYSWHYRGRGLPRITDVLWKMCRRFVSRFDGV